MSRKLNGGYISANKTMYDSDFDLWKRVLIPGTYILDYNLRYNLGTVIFKDRNGITVRLSGTKEETAMARDSLVQNGYTPMSPILMYPSSQYYNEYRKD